MQVEQQEHTSRCPLGECAVGDGDRAAILEPSGTDCATVRLQSSLTDAQRLLQQQGLDTNAVSGATRTATAQASGIFDQVG